MIKNIIERLVEVLYDVFPQYENDFINRALAYIKKLEDLIEPFYLKRKSEETQTIYFVGHYALSGFSEAFNLNIRALDENISPNSDPSSTEVTSFIKDLKDNGVKVLYREEIPDLNILNYIQSQVPNLASYTSEILRTDHRTVDIKVEGIEQMLYAKVYKGSLYDEVSKNIKVEIAYNEKNKDIVVLKTLTQV